MQVHDRRTAQRSRKPRAKSQRGVFINQVAVHRRGPDRHSLSNPTQPGQDIGREQTAFTRLLRREIRGAPMQADAEPRRQFPVCPLCQQCTQDSAQHIAHPARCHARIAVGTNADRQIGIAARTPASRPP